MPAHVTIVAVSKFHPRSAVLEALQAGVRDFGENYVQEARPKFDGIDLPHGARVHFIGHVQTNKAKPIAQTFGLVQSVDRASAASALSRAACDAGKTLPALLQVNISPAERFGCAPAEAEELAAQIRSLPGLQLEGVMAIGPLDVDNSAVRAAFRLASSVHQSIGGPILSIGMSGDWEIAVEEGATLIRIGTAIFGPRPARQVSKKTAISP